MQCRRERYFIVASTAVRVCVCVSGDDGCLGAQINAGFALTWARTIAALTTWPHTSCQLSPTAVDDDDDSSSSWFAHTCHCLYMRPSLLELARICFKL